MAQLLLLYKQVYKDDYSTMILIHCFYNEDIKDMLTTLTMEGTDEKVS